MFSNVFPENRAVDEIMWKNMVEPERWQKIWRVRVACWIIKGASAHTHAFTCALARRHKYVISFFYSSISLASAPQYYVISTSLVLI